ncbi:MAG: hypothetical protein A2514_01415 [Gammaproteobacteria bacterium RIFOXYD12_FULL_61_37]|nr:MAG: hypothetical protein A2514_01415 [Gammaproteobacteria bacterium RIFOXYD12_FULL_61_37]
MQKRLFSKLGVICGLVVLLLLPLSLIKGVIAERIKFRDQARDGIAQSWTGPQKLIGPVLVVPYVEHLSRDVWDTQTGKTRTENYSETRKLMLLPEALHVNGEAITEERTRGLYSVPVYTTRLALSGRFDTRRLVELKADASRRLTWQQPYLSVLVSDLRGVIKQPVLSWAGENVAFESGPRIDNAGSGMHAPLKEIGTGETREYAFKLDLVLRGMEGLSFSPLGKDTQVVLQSNWPHPNFTGRYLPSAHEIGAEGFRAEWLASSFSSLMPQAVEACLKGNCHELLDNTFGVSLIKTADIYQQSERSVKYGLLFLGLTFTLFFVYEVMKAMQVHPVQYLLVGLALSLFFLLLVSLSEHFSFPLAYGAAATACTLLLGVYVSAVLGSLAGGGIFTGMLALLYGVLFLIVRSEDNALLMGSVLLFVVLAGVMLVTRRVDWYSLGEKGDGIGSGQPEPLQG